MRCPRRTAPVVWQAEQAEDKTQEKSRGTSTEQVRAKHCQPEPQGARRSPDKDRVKTRSEREASDHTGGSATRH